MLHYVYYVWHGYCYIKVTSLCDLSVSPFVYLCLRTAAFDPTATSTYHAHT